MKYKILKGTNLYEQLMKLHSKMNKSNTAAKELVNSIGYTDFHIGYWCIAGGISGILMPQGNPGGWKKTKIPNAYLPAKIKRNEELLDKISWLPVVTYDDLNDVLNYNYHLALEERVSFHPGVSWRDEYILVAVSDKIEYTPLPDMIEITTTEYKELYYKEEQAA